MIKKSLLLLALLCGSAAAVAPGTVSKTSVDDFLKIAEKANEVRNYAMNEDAGLELMEESVVFEKRDTIKISYADIDTNAFRIVKNGCEVDLDIDKENKVITANVDFINSEGNFEIQTDDGRSIPVYFVKDGDSYVISTASADQAKHNVDSIKEIASTDGIEKISFKTIDNVKVDLDIKNTGRSLAGATGQFKYYDDYDNTIFLRGIKCKVIAQTNNGEVVLDEGYTDDEGRFSYIVDSNLVTIYPAIYFELTTEAPSITIVDETNNVYRWRSSAINPANGITNVDLVLNVEGAVGKGFAISQPSVMATRFAKFMNNDQYIDNCTLHYPEGTAGSWCTWNGHIYISGRTLTDAEKAVRPAPYACFDVVGHEYGHHVQNYFNITNNPGGTHYSRHNAEDDFHDEKNSDGTNKYTEAQARRRGIDLAYAEGWATAYSLLAQRHFADLYDGIRFACDDSYTSYNGVNVDYGAYQVCLGEGAEESVTTFIWNLFDDETTAQDPFDNVSYTDDLFYTFSHGSTTFSDFLMVFEDGEPDENFVGALLEKLKMAPTNIAAATTLYKNVAPTFKWTCAGGSKYYTNNEFDLYLHAHNDGNGACESYYTSVNVSGTPTEASITIPLQEWTRLVATGATELEIQVSGTVNRNGISTGGYTSKYYYIDMPTEDKIGPDPIVMHSTDWGFEQKYDNVVRTKGFVINDVDIATERLRTGCIEKNQIVMSAKKKGAGKAYFRITSDTGLENVVYNISLWSASEGINANNSTIILETMDATGEWTLDTNFWTDVTLPTNKNNMLELTTHNTEKIYGIKFTVTGPATGSSNNGRVALRDITFNF